MTDSTTPQDAAAMPPASDGSVASEPVAWAVMVGGQRMYVSWCKEMCEDEAYYHRHPCGDSVLVVPLHRQPTLTDAEREAVEWAVSAARNVEHPAETTLRGLLERMK